MTTGHPNLQTRIENDSELQFMTEASQRRDGLVRTLEHSYSDGSDNDRARMVLDMWASHFPNREPEH